MMNTTGRLAIMAIQLAGLLLSAYLVFVTYADRGQVEAQVQQVVLAQVERDAETAWVDREEADPAETGRLDRFRAFAGSLIGDVEAGRKRIVQGILANALAERCAPDCAPWIAEARITDNILLEKASGVKLGGTSLRDFVVGRYDRAVSGMTADLRRFGLVNVVVLALALGLMVTRGYLARRAAIFSVAVTAYAGWAAYGYVFQQDWARAIARNEWAASGYQFAMIFVACVFFDWLFLRGRITEFILNAISSAFSTWVP